jgi:hypothetical protein
LKDVAEQCTYRNFWKEAIESLADEYKYKDWPPEEWNRFECDRNELLDVVTIAKNKCLKAQWTIQIAGRTINLRECLTQIVDWVRRFTQVSDQSNITYAALPWAGFRFLLQAGRR